VILTGGLDLSFPGRSALRHPAGGQPSTATYGPLVYALPDGAAVGALTAVVKRLRHRHARISPIVMTLAMNGILQGVALLYFARHAAGFSAPLMRAGS